MQLSSYTALLLVDCDILSPLYDLQSAVDDKRSSSLAITTAAAAAAAAVTHTHTHTFIASASELTVH